VGLANVAPAPRDVDADTVTGFGTFEFVHGSDGPLDVRDGRLTVPGLGFAWYAEP
jgi:amylosucrase